MNNTEKLSWYQRNKEKALANQKKLYQSNKDKRKEYIKEHFKQNIERYRQYSKKYCLRDKEKRNAYTRRKIKEDPIFACKAKLASAIAGSAKRADQQLPFRTRHGVSKLDLESTLGCTIEQFVEYFNKLFVEGMTWSNHGVWHIDHIKPIATATTVDEVIELNHYTNLQPLWASDNIAKSSSWQGVRVKRPR